MADNWQIGDLALCIKTFLGEREPQSGGIYTVASLDIHPLDGDLYLGLEGFDHNEGVYWAARFRRIPPHIPDAEDAETIRLLNSDLVPVTRAFSAILVRATPAGAPTDPFFRCPGLFDPSAYCLAGVPSLHDLGDTDV